MLSQEDGRLRSALAAAEAARKAGGRGSRAAAEAAKGALKGGGAVARSWRAAGGLPALVALLRPPSSTAALPSALSALADCCLDSDCAKEVGELGIERELVNMLSRSTDRDEIVNRVCRLMGNLSAEKTIAEKLHKEEALPALLKVIENAKTPMPTLLLAVRAIRLLWMVEKYQEEMISKNVVKAIATLLSKQCEEAKLINSTNKTIIDGKRDIACKRRRDLFNGILKCLGYFTVHSTYRCAEQILGDGLGYHCLVCLVKYYESLALQCIINLCYIDECRPHLGAAGAVECLIDLLKNQLDWPLPWIKALRLLCRESVNRLKILEYGGISLLLNVVKDKTKLNRHLYGLQALTSFIYDEYAMTVMANLGFVEIITQLLKDYVDTMKCEHQYTNDIKNSDSKICIKDVIENDAIDDDSMDSEYKDKSTEEFICLTYKNKPKITNKLEASPNKKAKRDLNPNDVLDSKCTYWNCAKNSTPYLSPFSDCSMSPEYSKNTKLSKHLYLNIEYSNNASCNDNGLESFSSPSSPYCTGVSLSPSSMSQFDDDSSDSEKSGHYSPVYSDEEETVAPLENDDLSETEEEFMTNDKFQLNPEADYEITVEEQIQTQAVKYLLLILSQYSYTAKIVPTMSSWELIYSLIHYIEKCKHPATSRASKILYRIISDVINFKNLLRHSIIIHCNITIEKPKHSKCKQCKQINKLFHRITDQISTIAESDYGIQSIINFLSYEDINDKDALIISMPFIIKSMRLLRKLFIDYKTMELFLCIFSARKKPLRLCVSALSNLATSLEIRAPKPVINGFKDTMLLEYNPTFNNSDEIVFILDDLSEVRADQRLLCKHSDFFSAMLKGSFKEGLQKSVRLQKATKCGLEYLFALLEFGILTKQLDTFPLPEALSTALETLLLADRFLIDKVKNLLFSAIVQFKLDYMTADQVYIWSLDEGMGTLCAESVAYTLVGDMSDDKKYRIVSTIMDTKYKDQWIDDVRHSLLCFME